MRRHRAHATRRARAGDRAAARDGEHEPEPCRSEERADRRCRPKAHRAADRPGARSRPAHEPLPVGRQGLQGDRAPGVPVGQARGGAVDSRDVALHRSLPGDREREGELLGHEPQPEGVLDVRPRARVAVVVVVTDVERERAQRDGGRVGVEQVERAVARMPSRVGARMRRPGVGQRAEGVQELVRCDGGRRDVGARTEVHDPRPLPVRTPGSLAARVDVVDGAVVVDELLLVLRTARREQNGVGDAVVPVARTEPRRSVGQLDDEDVRLRTARERGAVEARLAQGVLSAPPRVDLVDVGGDPRCELRAPVEAIGRIGVHDADRPARDGRRSVLGRRGPAPGSGNGALGNRAGCDRHGDERREPGRRTAPPAGQ